MQCNNNLLYSFLFCLQTTVCLQSAASVTPSNSYGLARKSKDLKETMLTTEPQQLEHGNLARVLMQQLQSDCLSRELEETPEGVCITINIR
jgi:hypothetical protein